MPTFTALHRPQAQAVQRNRMRRETLRVRANNGDDIAKEEIDKQTVSVDFVSCLCFDDISLGASVVYESDSVASCGRMSKQDRTSWRRKKFIDYWCVGYVEHWRHYRLVSIGVAGCALQWEASSRKRPRLIRNRNEGRVIFLG